jgi:hypothetical protein
VRLQTTLREKRHKLRSIDFHRGFNRKREDGCSNTSCDMQSVLCIAISRQHRQHPRHRQAATQPCGQDISLTRVLARTPAPASATEQPSFSPSTTNRTSWTTLQPQESINRLCSTHETTVVHLAYSPRLNNVPACSNPTPPNPLSPASLHRARLAPWYPQPRSHAVPQQHRCAHPPRYVETQETERLVRDDV